MSRIEIANANREIAGMCIEVGDNVVYFLATKDGIAWGGACNRGLLADGCTEWTCGLQTTLEMAVEDATDFYTENN